MIFAAEELMPESFDVRLSMFDFRKMPSDKFSFSQKLALNIEHLTSKYRTSNIEKNELSSKTY